MKKCFIRCYSLVLVISILFSAVVFPVHASDYMQLDPEIYDVEGYEGEIWKRYSEIVDTELWPRLSNGDRYYFARFAELTKDNWWFEMAANMSGNELNEEQYTKILINIMALMDLNTQDMIYQQAEADTLKTIEDYGWDLAEIAINGVSLFSALDPNINTIVDNIADNVALVVDAREIILHTSEELEFIERAMKHYDQYISFLNAIATYSDDDNLKAAANNLADVTNKALYYRLHQLESVSGDVAKWVGHNMLFDMILMEDMKENAASLGLSKKHEFALETLAIMDGIVAGLNFIKGSVVLISDLSFDFSNNFNRYSEIQAMNNIRKALIQQISGIKREMENSQDISKIAEIRTQLLQLVYINVRGEYCMKELFHNKKQNEDKQIAEESFIYVSEQAVEDELLLNELIPSADEFRKDVRYDGVKILSKCVYGQDGEIQEVKKYDYNERGLVQNLTEWTLESGLSGSFLSVSRTVSYRYDDKSNLIEERSWYGTSETEIDYEYDQFGKLTNEYWRHSGRSKEYQYDSKGQLVCDLHRNKNGVIDDRTDYEYDQNGNLVKWATEFESETYTYDENGHLISTPDHIYEYDDAWNLIYEEEFYGDMHFVIEYEYDQENRLVRRTENSSGTELITEYTYDQYGNVKTQKDIFETGEQYHIYTYGTVNITNDTAPWKEAYLKYLRTELEYSPKDEKFYLVDLDGDSIPELIVDSHVVAYGLELCTFDGVKVNNIHLRGLGSISYILGQNYVLNESGHFGIYQDDIYCVKDGNITCVATGIWSDTGEVQRRWNDVEVSEQVYNDNLKASFDTDSAIYLSSVDVDDAGKIVVGHNVYTYSQILSVLTGEG